MAVAFGGDRRDWADYCNKNRIFQILCQDQHKGLSLDPHRNHHLPDQNQNINGDGEEEEEEEGNHEPVAMSFQELLHQNQLLYARRLDGAGHQPPPELLLSPPPTKKRSYFLPSSSYLEPISENARKMGEDHLNPEPLVRSADSRGSAALVGEIVEVQGGHIVRSTGRKDRHSKVCTAKGPRDRRVRLAAHTAIQFYDVQDRLGYDRPSKAVDWLMKKAKAAIDELAELPTWHPMAAAAISSTPDIGFGAESTQNKLERRQNQPHIMVVPDASDSSGKRPMAMIGGMTEHMSTFLPSSLDSDVIADTMKSFFPMGGGCAAGESSSTSMQFQSFSSSDLFSRNSNSQDLRLSLQSFQNPNFLHHHTPELTPHEDPSSHHHHHQHARSQGTQHVLLTGTPLGFDGWQPPLEQLQPVHRLPPWSSGIDGATAGFSFSSPHMLGGGSGMDQFRTSTQRGPLQSSNTDTPSVRAWMNPPDSMPDHHHPPQALPVYPPSTFAGGLGFSGYGVFSGFHIPAPIQGDGEENDGYSDKPSSASSDSRQ